MTETVKHTPGPWFFDGPPDNLIVWEWNNADNRICFMTSDGPAKENARLIAAAPDLLEFVRQHAKRDPVFAKGHEKQVIADARALVAKAEGRS